jgi:uncharacterized membrane protein
MKHFNINKLLINFLYIALATLLTTSVYAEKAGGGMTQQRSQAVEAQQTSKMMSGGMMKQEHMREMSQLMLQTRDMIGDMSQLMQRDRIRDPDHMNNMAEMSAQLGNTLQEMSQQMKRGNLTDQERTQLQKRLKDMNTQMEQLQKDVTQ